MAEARVTAAVLTRNRAHFLRQCLESILTQEGVELDVVVFDNASNDDTPEVVRSFTDPRLTYLRHETDIGMLRSWSRGIDLAVERSPFVSIFHDDDLMLPGFLAESVDCLRRHLSAGFSLVLCQFITQDGTPKGILDPGDVKDGLNNGLDFLELIIQGRGIAIYPPTVIFRSETLKRAGAVDSPHTCATADMNLYYRAAAISGALFIRKPLVQCRWHEDSDTLLLTRIAGGTLWYGTMAERIDAIAYLLRSPRADDPKYRDWLTERLLSAHAHQSTAIHPSVPQMYHTWDNRRAIFLDQLEKALPPQAAFLLADDLQLGIEGTFSDRRVIPFLERDGQYWGAPADSAEAISELERLRKTGARWLVIAWPSLWWLDQYGSFDRHVRTSYRLALSSPHGLVFDLKGRGA